MTVEDARRGPAGRAALGSVPPLPVPDPVLRIRNGEDPEAVMYDVLREHDDDRQSWEDKVNEAGLDAEAAAEEAENLREGWSEGVADQVRAVHDRFHRGPFSMCFDPVCDEWRLWMKERGLS